MLELYLDDFLMPVYLVRIRVRVRGTVRVKFRVEVS